MPYYRFWKKVGRGNWKKYEERYLKPRGVENTQRLVFPWNPTFQQAKSSAQWNWLLPKKMAAATNSNELLDTWAFYRHKRKKMHHYVQILQRLVHLGGCNPADWRFQLITSRLFHRRRRVINLPRIALLLGKIHATKDLESLTPFLLKRAHLYDSQQLSFILESHSLCSLYNKHLFATVSRLFFPLVPHSPLQDLLRTVQALSTLRYTETVLISSITREIISRVSSPSPPSLLSLLSLADSLSSLRIQSQDLLDLISDQVLSSSEKSRLSPALLLSVAKVFHKSRVNDIPLFSYLLQDTLHRPHDYSPDALLGITSIVSTIIPRSAKNAQEAYNNAITFADRFAAFLPLPQLMESVRLASTMVSPAQNFGFRRCLLNSESSRNVFAPGFLMRSESSRSPVEEKERAGGEEVFAMFVGGEETEKKNLTEKSVSLYRKNLSSFVQKMSVYVEKCLSPEKGEKGERGDRGEKSLDFIKLSLSLLQFNAMDSAKAKKLLRLIHRQIEEFEPSDFSACARLLERLKEEIGYVDVVLANALARRALQREDEFVGAEFHLLSARLISLGIREEHGKRLRRVCEMRGNNQKLERGGESKEVETREEGEERRGEERAGEERRGKEMDVLVDKEMKRERRVHHNYRKMTSATETQSNDIKAPTHASLPNVSRTVFTKPPRKYN